MKFAAAIAVYLWFIIERAAGSSPGPNFTKTEALNVNATGLTIFCWYPVSGNYGRLPRILFYCTIAFALLARRYTWLIAGALAAALIYSGTAAIHACILTWRGQASGENDIWALIAILAPACIITVPLLNWSKTLRRLGSSEDRETAGVRTIIIFWASLMTIAFFSLLGYLWSDDTGSLKVNLALVESIACLPPRSSLNNSAGQSPYWERFYVDDEWVKENNCFDPCRETTYYLWPIATFRDSADMQIATMSQIEKNFDGGSTITSQKAADRQQQQYWDYFIVFGVFGSILAAFIILQGAWVVCAAGWKSAVEARDALYLSISGLSLPFRRGPRRERLLQKRIAKYAALVSYLWAIFASVLCIPMVLITIISMEIRLDAFPSSESSAHIGAWTPWASTGLVFVAAFTARYGNFGNLFYCAKFESLRSSELSGQRRMPTRLVIYRMKTMLKIPCDTLVFWARHHWRSLIDFYRDPDSVRTPDYETIALRDGSER